MFDPKGRLVICNRPYQRIYGLPEQYLKPGTRLEDILAYLFDQGMSAGEDRESYVEWRRDVISRGVYGKSVHELNGRIIMMQHHPMKDGGWVSTHEDVTEQRQTEARMHHLARHDALTDLPNRIQFLEEMGAMEMAIARGERAAVLWIDIDHFKAINDTLGHAMGDAVLKQVSARLWGTTRETDVLARLSGDEFSLLLKPIDGPREAALVAERIVKAIGAPLTVAGQQIMIGASVGVALAPGDGTTADALMKNADLACYRAKSDGRSTYHFFEPGMDAALQRRRSIEAGLRTALAHNELRLAFQPLVGLPENRITCFEALLRWEHADRGAISPVEFIPVAEETGLIQPIGEWVLREACRTAAGWPGQVRVAVNMSPVQFRNPRLFDTVQAAIAEARLSPDRLEIEITESLLLTDSEQTLETLHRLRDLGVRIALDDFGTGYSSLSYLRRFPFDKIKIDRSFMRDLTRKGDSLAIIKAIIGLGHSLGMELVAEGVETEEQLNAVREQGCNEVQGFYFSPPMPPTAVQLLLETTGGRGIGPDRKPHLVRNNVTPLRA
jgi:diguanylate cyclase (GGDEF)-like protein